MVRRERSQAGFVPLAFLPKTLNQFACRWEILNEFDAKLRVHAGSANRRVPMCSSVSGKQIVLGRARASRLQVAPAGR